MTDIRFARIGTNGISLHVAQAGRMGDPLLLLLHGFPEYWETWRDYMTTFARCVGEFPLFELIYSS
jgi:epoxide hydrolase 4